MVRSAKSVKSFIRKQRERNPSEKVDEFRSLNSGFFRDIGRLGNDFTDDQINVIINNYPKLKIPSQAGGTLTSVTSNSVLGYLQDSAGDNMSAIREYVLSSIGSNTLNRNPGYTGEISAFIENRIPEQTPSTQQLVEDVSTSVPSNVTSAAAPPTKTKPERKEFVVLPKDVKRPFQTPKQIRERDAGVRGSRPDDGALTRQRRAGRFPTIDEITGGESITSSSPTLPGEAFAESSSSGSSATPSDNETSRNQRMEYLIGLLPEYGVSVSDLNSEITPDQLESMLISMSRAPVASSESSSGIDTIIDEPRQLQPRPRAPSSDLSTQQSVKSVSNVDDLNIEGKLTALERRVLDLSEVPSVSTSDTELERTIDYLNQLLKTSNLTDDRIAISDAIESINKRLDDRQGLSSIGSISSEELPPERSPEIQEFERLLNGILPQSRNRQGGFVSPQEKFVQDPDNIGTEPDVVGRGTLDTSRLTSAAAPRSRRGSRVEQLKMEAKLDSPNFKQESTTPLLNRTQNQRQKEIEDLRKVIARGPNPFGKTPDVTFRQKEDRLQKLLAIERGMENAVDTTDLESRAQLASATVNTGQALNSIAEEYTNANHNLDGLDSTPLDAEFVEQGIAPEIASQTVNVNEALEAGEGQVNPSEIANNQDSIEAPVKFGTNTIVVTPEDAKKLNAGSLNPEAAPFIPEGEEERIPAETVEATRERLKSLGYEGVDEIFDEMKIKQRSEDIIAAREGQQVQTQGQQSGNVRSGPAIHPDALGIFFGSSTAPDWDQTLLADRERRFINMSPDSIKPFLLQQNKQIFDKFGVDILVPMLKSDASSSVELIKRENLELLQLYTKLTGLQKGSSDKVEMKIRDIVNFAGLLAGTQATPTQDFKGAGTGEDPRTNVNPESGSSSRVEPRSVQQEPQRFNYKNTSGVRTGESITHAEALTFHLH
jgi:hypothetical protein